MTAAEGPAAPSPPVPTCYRHPDRETYVRCTRCERPICPDCMIPASVGFQCPDDVKAGNKGMRQARTTFGGRPTGQSSLVTRTIIAVTAIGFLAQQISGRVTDELELASYLLPFDDPGGVGAGQVYRLLTVVLTHGSILHILLNMYALWIVGPMMEAQLGRLRFLVVYLVSALGGSVLSYAFLPPGSGGVGASGAVFGLFGAQIVIARRLRLDASGVIAVLAINLVFSFLFPGIDWRAHVGGMVTGAAVAAALAYAPRTRRTAVQGGGIALVVLLVAVAGVVRTAQLQDRVDFCETATAAFPAAGYACLRADG